MTVGTVSVTSGANSTLPDGSDFSYLESSAGAIPLVGIGYSPDGATAPTPLMDENGVIVQGETTITDLTVATTNTPISIGDAAADTQLIASNSNRRGWRVQNMSTADLYVRLSSSAAALSSCHAVLRQYESIGQKIMDGDLYTGEIRGRWASDAGGTAVGGDW